MGPAVRWYGLSDSGKEAAVCLWAADRLCACGLAVPRRLAARLSAALRQSDDLGAARPAGPVLAGQKADVRRRRLTRPEEIVRWAMASGVCDAALWGQGAALRIGTLVLPDGVDPGMASGGRHPVWYGGVAAGHRTWDQLSPAGFEAMVGLLAVQHLRARGFVPPDDLEARSCGALERWLREVRRRQRRAGIG